MDTNLLTLQEAADSLGKSTQTIRRMIKRGELKAQRVKTPQGFHYLVEKPSEEPSEDMFSNSTIQNQEKPIIEELKAAPTYQIENPTSQSDVYGILENDFYVIDVKAKPNEDFEKFKELTERHHREKMDLLGVVDKLQNELSYERLKPRGFFDRLMDWLFS